MKFKIKVITLSFLLLLNLSTFASVKIYAHRGGRALWPENTLYAYQHAIKYPIDFIDMDVVLSKDGELIIYHDLRLNPFITKNAKGNWIKNSPALNHLTLDEIKQYSVGSIRKGSAYANSFPAQENRNHLAIPTLLEVLNWMKHSHINKLGLQIEIKTNPKSANYFQESNRIVTRLDELLKQFKFGSRVEIQSFDFLILDKLHKKNKSLKLAYLTDKNHPIISPNKTKQIKKFDIVDTVFKHQATLWEPPADEVNAQQIQKAHQLGLQVVVWGLSASLAEEKKQIQRLVKMCVDGIITDRPNLAKYIRSLVLTQSCARMA